MASYEQLQKWSDERIVNKVLAEVDTKIDRYVLMERAQDAMRRDTIRLERYMAAGVDFDDALRDMRNRRPHEDQRIADTVRSHTERDEDLQRMIEQIRASDMDIKAERDFNPGFDRLDGNIDKYLAYVLYMAGPNYADEESGSTEWHGYFMRFGRVILWYDDRGFVTADVWENEAEAQKMFAKAESEYHEWLGEDEQD